VLYLRGQKPSKPGIIAFIVILGAWLGAWLGVWATAFDAQAREGAVASPSEPSLLSRYSFNSVHKRSRLPKYLREISGLAADSNQRVILHHDNNARIWSFDSEGAQLNEDSLQDQPVKGDFEGIARFNEKVVLSASFGVLKIAQQIADAPSDQTPELQVQPGWIELPFKALCNFEGLAIVTHSDRRGTLLMPCKYPRFEEAGEPAADDERLYVFRHGLNRDASLSSKTLQRLAINVTPVLQAYRLPRLRPSAIEVVGERLLILAGKERVLLETDMDGNLISWRRLRWPRHRQAEGLTILPNGTLLIADEGRWLGGTVTQYKPASGSLSPHKRPDQ